MGNLRRITIAFALGFIVCFIEGTLFETAYGGMFTILFGWTMDLMCYAIAVGLSLLLGLTFKTPKAGAFWRDLGIRTLFISVVGIVVIFISPLIGLRTLEPNSGYKMMPFALWFFCLLLIAFPIVNFPQKKE
jgi:hypothetical protein